MHTSPTAMVIICGVKPMPAEPDSNSPSKILSKEYYTKWETKSTLTTTESTCSQFYSII